MTKQQKRKRLSDFDFTYEGAAVALVSESQGGPANGYPTLITKATNDITEEDIKKAQALEQVSLSGESSGNVKQSATQGSTSPENNPDNLEGESMDINKMLESPEGQEALNNAVTAAVEAAVGTVNKSHETEIESLKTVIKGFQDKEESQDRAELLNKAKEAGIKEEDLEETVNQWYDAKKAGFGHIVDESITRHVEARKALESSDLFVDVDTKEISSEEQDKKDMMKGEINKTRGIKEDK